MADERTALQILNAIEDELGLDRSTSVDGTAISTRQRLAFINNSIEEMYQFGHWSGLELEHIIEIGAPLEVSGTLTADSATVTIADTSTISPATAFMVQGEGIQNNTRLVSVTNATTFVMDKTALTSGASDLTIVRDTFAIPDDFQKPIAQTQWDARLMWSMIGPTSSQWDAFQRNGIVGPFPRRQYRRQGPRPTAFRIFPPPTATGSYPGTLSWRYYSNEGVIADGDSVPSKRFFTANGDTSVFPDRVLILGGKWRWQQAKGFDFGPLQEEYYSWFDATLATDTGGQTVALDGNGDWGYPDRLGYGYNVPDGNFPSV
jgi:hypothetical protein